MMAASGDRLRRHPFSLHCRQAVEQVRVCEAPSDPPKVMARSWLVRGQLSTCGVGDGARAGACVRVSVCEVTR